MPTVSVSIRNEDYDKWRALDSPAAFIHNALNETPIMQRAYHKSDQNDKHLMEELAGIKPIKTPKVDFGQKAIDEYEAGLKPVIKSPSKLEVIKTSKDAEKATGWQGSNFKKKKK